MVKTIGRNRNQTNTLIQQASYSINSTTATKIADVSDPNDARVMFSVSLDCLTTPPACIFIKLQGSSVDNNKVGEVLFRNFTGNDSPFQMRYEMTSDQIYTGEISAIALSGGPFTIYVTEY